MTPASALVRHSRPAIWVLERTIKQTGFLAQCVLFVAVVVTAISSISELAARETMLSILISRSNALTAEFVERTRTGSVSGVAAGQAAVTFEKQRFIAMAQLEGLEQLKRRVHAISVLGARSALGELSAIHYDFATLGVEASWQEKYVSSGPPPVPGAMRSEDFQVMPRDDWPGHVRVLKGSASSPIPLGLEREPRRPLNSVTSMSSDSTSQSWFGFLDPVLDSFSFLRRLSSDRLLAIVVLGCGAVGAMISSLRADQSLTLRSFVLGLASGFVTYLLLKGGKHLFLVQSQVDAIAFNPYGCAFAGLLAGLFTEKAHQVLAFLVEDLGERIKAASTNARVSNSNSSGPGAKSKANS